MALDHFVRMDGTTKRSSAVIDTDIITEPMMNWGTTGTPAIGAVAIPILDTAGAFTATDVEAALAEVGARNFNSRRYLSGAVPISVASGATIAPIIAADQVPNNVDEVIAEQSTTNWGTLLGASHIGIPIALPGDPGVGVAMTVENRRILGILVDVNGDPFLLAGGEQIFYYYDTMRTAGQTLYNAGGNTQIQLVYNNAGVWRSAAIVGAVAHNVYTWPVIRYDLTKLPEDAMLYGGGGAEAIDNSPYTAGTGIGISGTYSITFDQGASLATLAGTWTAVAAFTLNAAAAGFSDGLTVPVNAGAPGVTVGPEGTIMWDSTGDNLYVSQGGGTWKQISSAASLPASTAAGDLLIGDGALGWAVETPTRINASGDITNTATAGADDFTIALAGAFDVSMILSSTGTGADAIQIRTSAGGMVIDANNAMTMDAGGVLELNSDGGAISIGNDANAFALNLGTAGARTITIGSATGATAVDIKSGTAGINLHDGVAQLDMNGAGALTETALVSADLTPSGALTLRGGGLSTFGDDVGIWSFDGAGALSTSGITTADLQTSGAITIDSSGATIGIGTDANAFGINIGTGGAARTITVGNTTTTTALVFNAGTGGTTFNIPDADAAAFLIQQGADGYLNIDTTNGTEVMTFGSLAIDPDFSFIGDGTFTQSGSGQVSFAGNMNATGGLDVTGADLTVGANFAVGVDGLVDNGTWQADVIATTYGGTGQNWGATVAGGLPYFSGAGTMGVLAIGAAGQALRVNAAGTLPEWGYPQGLGTSSILSKSAILIRRVLSLASTGDLEEADAGGQTKISAVGVARVAQPGVGAAVDMVTSGLVSCQLPAAHAAITAGQIAYLAQTAATPCGFVVSYQDIAYTGGYTILPIGIFTQSALINAGTAINVMLGAPGTHPVLV